VQKDPSGTKAESGTGWGMKGKNCMSDRGGNGETAAFLLGREGSKGTALSF